MKIFKLVTWFLNMIHIMWNDMVQYTFNFHKDYKSFKLFLEYICVFEYISTLHSFSQIYFTLSLYKMKWDSLYSNLLPRLYSNIICKNIMNFFRKFEVGYIQTCTSLESSIMWHPKGVTVMCFARIFGFTMYYLSSIKRTQRTKQSLSNTLQENLSNKIRKHIQQIKRSWIE